MYLFDTNNEVKDPDARNIYRQKVALVFICLSLFSSSKTSGNSSHKGVSSTHSLCTSYQGNVIADISLAKSQKFRLRLFPRQIIFCSLRKTRVSCFLEFSLCILHEKEKGKKKPWKRVRVVCIPTIQGRQNNGLLSKAKVKLYYMPFTHKVIKIQNKSHIHLKDWKNLVCNIRSLWTGTVRNLW